LKARDQKQLDFEGLSDYLHQTEQEKERTLYPNRKFNNNVHIADYVTDKINEVRGVNMEQAKKEKIIRLNKKLIEVNMA
jgi:sorting nexin-4